MKLSEAIKIGASLHGSTQDEYLVLDNEFDVEGSARTCAMGAAFEGCTGLLPVDDPIDYYGLDDPRVRALLHNLGMDSDDSIAKIANGDYYFDDIVNMAVQKLCDVPKDAHIQVPGEEKPDFWFNAVVTLNDNLEWERERIAVYLERLGL